VESPYALFLQVGDFEPLAAVAPLSNGIEVSTFEQLRNAILRGDIDDDSTAPIAGTRTIIITQDITIPLLRPQITSGLNITLITNNPAGVALISDETTHFVVNGGSLTLGEENDPVASNITLTRTDPTAATIGGGVLITGGGNFTMYGSAITGNRASAFGGGVLVENGTFTMRGGEISGNYATQGGGVQVQANGIFNMYGGRISENIVEFNNTDLNGGGAVNIRGPVIIGGSANAPFNANTIGTANLTIEPGGTITVPANLRFATAAHAVIHNNGTIVNNGMFRNNGTINNDGVFTNSGQLYNSGTITNPPAGVIELAAATWNATVPDISTWAGTTNGIVTVAATAGGTTLQIPENATVSMSHFLCLLTFPQLRP
jgi:hypothetical protein